MEGAIGSRRLDARRAVRPAMTTFKPPNMLRSRRILSTRACAASRGGADRAAFVMTLGAGSKIGWRRALQRGGQPGRPLGLCRELGSQRVSVIATATNTVIVAITIGTGPRCLRRVHLNLAASFVANRLFTASSRRGRQALRGAHEERPRLRRLFHQRRQNPRLARHNSANRTVFEKINNNSQ
jgi:YVTN family beta-propeller protein